MLSTQEILSKLRAGEPFVTEKKTYRYRCCSEFKIIERADLEKENWDTYCPYEILFSKEILIFAVFQKQKKNVIKAELHFSKIIFEKGGENG